MEKDGKTLHYKRKSVRKSVSSEKLINTIL